VRLPDQHRRRGDLEGGLLGPDAVEAHVVHLREDAARGRSSQPGAMVTSPRATAPVPHVPGLGQHTPEILEDLGYADAEIAALVDRGVVAAGLDPLPAATESVGAAEGSMPPR
jgi:hypothetical protein